MRRLEFMKSISSEQVYRIKELLSQSAEQLMENNF